MRRLFCCLKKLKSNLETEKEDTSSRRERKPTRFEDSGDNGGKHRFF